MTGTVEKGEKFAGSNSQRAGYYPEDGRFPPDFEPAVEHREAVGEP